jgi:hypothetical protein
MDNRCFRARYFPPIVLAIGVLLASSASSVSGQELWVYAQTNLLVPEEVEKIERLMQRAKSAGYTHILIADSKFSRLSQLDQRYFHHVDRIKKLAADLEIRLVPTVCSVGYSNDILSLNPNLAEGLPVRDALYQMQSGLATHVPDSNISLPSVSDRRKWGFIDESLKLENDHLRSSEPHTPNVRISKKIVLQPFRQYHVSVDLKTQNFDTPVEIKVLTKSGRNLNYTNLGTQPTQDWRTHHVTFNALDNDDATLYIGAWGPQRGSLSIRRPTLSECGAVNLIRRESAPIRVAIQGADGSQVQLVEGTDFQSWTDPKLGVTPYGGEYDVWHEEPPIRMIRKLPDGTKLRVSYFHTHIVYDGQVCGTASDMDFQKLLDDQIASMTRLFPDADFMMSHDEYRVMGWTSSTIPGLSKDASPGAVLSHNAKHCSEQLFSKAREARVTVWSDMFDPHHNAVDQYYLVNGSLRESHAPSNVRIMNWNFGKREESLNHFAKRGHSQVLAGYYDSDPEQISQWLDTVVGSKIPNVQGVMYTTWRRNYSDLEEFAGLVRSHRWYTSSKR